MTTPPRIYAVRTPYNVGGQNRVGHQCQALRIKNNLVHVRFADGAETVLSRFRLRSLPESAIASPGPTMPA